MQVQVQLLRETAQLPTKAHDSDVGWDLYYDGPLVELAPGRRHAFGTGLVLHIPPGYGGIIKPRSGLALRSGIDVLAGVIDPHYPNEVLVCLHNEDAQASAWFKAGDRIAQIVFVQVPDVQLMVVASYTKPEDAQRSGGFGSTGQ